MSEIILSHANMRVPRYTSYPPATAFGASPDETRYRNWLSDLDPALAAAIYIHVPFCREGINNIMCVMRADLGQIIQKHGFHKSVLDKEIIACRKYESDGLVAVNGRQLRIYEQGRPALRSIASCFEAYLDPEKSRHALAV